MLQILRILVSAVVATFAVVIVAGSLIRHFEHKNTDDNDPATLIQNVDRIDLADHPELLKMIRDGKSEDTRPKPPPEPPAIIPQRQVSGFVQLAFTVNPDGSTSDVKVIGAAPSGYYEDQARQIVQARHYTPDKRDGQPVASEQTDIIQFTAPAHSAGTRH